MSTIGNVIKLITSEKSKKQVKYAKKISKTKVSKYCIVNSEFKMLFIIGMREIWIT